MLIGKKIETIHEIDEFDKNAIKRTAFGVFGSKKNSTFDTICHVEIPLKRCRLIHQGPRPTGPPLYKYLIFAFT